MRTMDREKYNGHLIEMELSNAEIIVGTYEEFVLGYKLKCTDNVFSFIQTFANHSHTASVRCVTSNGLMMASGGADETVRLYDMDKRKDAGVLMHHNGTVSCVEFSPDGSHLISGGEDGMLAICRIGSFQIEKIWNNAHKSGVVGISVHPTGKLALSVGVDAVLRTWNLVKGRQAYASRLGSSKCGAGWQITDVQWNTSGTLYAVGIASKADVYSVASAAVSYIITTDTKINCLSFLSNDVLCLGCEDGNIYIHDVKKKCCLYKTKAHDQRIKSLNYIVSVKYSYIISVSSSGEIKLWKYTQKSLQELCNVKTGCRITCLTVTKCFSSNVKEEETMLNDTEDMKNYLSETNIPVRTLKREVVIIEEERDEKDLNDKSSMKKKSKSASSAEMTGGHVQIAKKTFSLKNMSVSPLSNSFKQRKLKNKQTKTTLRNTWEITDLKR